jgi:hypothetical protein
MSIVPQSITFVDPVPDGIAVLVPNAFEKMPQWKPAMLLWRRGGEELFDRFWIPYEQAFENATRLSRDGIHPG